MYKFNSKSKLKLILLGPFSLSCFFFGLYVYMTPYLSILAFKSALEKQDYTEANKFINDPSVRTSLKKQLKVNITNTVVKEMSGNPFAALGIMLVNPIVNGIVEATVNPRGLNLLLSTGKLSNPDNEVKDNKISSNHDATDKSDSTRLYYIGFNRFVLSSKIPEAKDTIKGFWRREKLVFWRLESIDIPSQLLNYKK